MFAAILGTLLCTQPAPAPLPAPVREFVNCTIDGSRWPYLVQTPAGEPRAVLIYLHGHYSDENQGMTEGIYGDAFGKLRRECLTREWAYVTAWYGGNTWMGPLGEQGLADLIGVLRARWPGRPVYLCGGSMGGSSTLVFAVRRPDLIDGALAFCPAADVRSYYEAANRAAEGVHRSIADAIRIHYTVDGRALDEQLAARSALENAERLTMPVYIASGGADDIIPVGPARELAARLEALGRPVRYVEIPGGGHDAPIVEVEWSDPLDFITSAAP